MVLEVPVCEQMTVISGTMVACVAVGNRGKTDATPLKAE